MEKKQIAVTMTEAIDSDRERKGKDLEMEPMNEGKI